MPKATSKAAITTEKGLVIERRFTSPGVHPYDELEWETRDAIIGDPQAEGGPAFEQKDVSSRRPGRRTPPTSSPRSTSAASSARRTARLP